MDANLQVFKIKQTHILLDYYLENVMFEIKKFYIEHLYFTLTKFLLLLELEFEYNYYKIFVKKCLY